MFLKILVIEICQYRNNKPVTLNKNDFFSDINLWYFGGFFALTKRITFVVISCRFNIKKLNKVHMDFNFVPNLPSHRECDGRHEWHVSNHYDVILQRTRTFEQTATCFLCHQKWIGGFLQILYQTQAVLGSLTYIWVFPVMYTLPLMPSVYVSICAPGSFLGAFIVWSLQYITCRKLNNPRLSDIRRIPSAKSKFLRVRVLDA